MEKQSYGEQFYGAFHKAADSAPVKGELVPVPLHEMLMKACEGNTTAAMNLMSKVLAPSLKAIGTVDIAPLRLVDVPADVSLQYNQEARFLDFLATKPVRSITDYQLRIIEENIGSQFSSMLNLDSTTLPANVQGAFYQRYNTVTVTGDTIQLSMMAQNINNLQGIGNVNLFENQVALEAVRIRRQENKTLLSNVEVVSELAPQVPQLGGFINRSTNAPIACGGSNFTNALLQQGVDQIRAFYGAQVPLALFCGAGQLAVIRDLMINRFPGETSATHLELMRQSLAAAGQAARGLMTNVVYMPYPGLTIPVYYDQDMPANTAILFKADEPQIARMSWQGQGNGPFIAMRPYAPMFDLALVFDIYSLHDPQQVSRVVYSNLAS